MSRQIDVKALVSHIVRGDGADKCRICMGDTSEGQVHLGDTVMLDGDTPVTLAELLETITGVEMSEEAYIPQGVCVACTSAAVTANELRLRVRNSVNIWTQVIETLNEIPISYTPQVKSVCALVRSDLTLQIVNDAIGGDPKTVLNRIKASYAKRKQVVTEKKPRMVRMGSPCKCPDCGKNFLSPYYLYLHLKNSGQKDACTICGLILIRGQEMKNHLVSKHGETVFMCSECPSMFGSELELKEHAKKAHRPGALTCGDCGRTFSRLGTFEAHSQMHAVRTCRNCGAQFSNRSCYREHRSICEPEAKPDSKKLPRSRRSNIRDPATFTCDYCGKTYTSRPQLKNHIIWIHMDVRPHQCQWCGKRFYTPARLAEHSVVHTRERNFECDICGAKLVSKMAAVYHRRRHTGEKPYECEDCGERFISASRRSEHAKRKHGKGTRMQCSLCPASFVRGHELRKHVTKAHPNGKEPSYICGL